MAVAFLGFDHRSLPYHESEHTGLLIQSGLFLSERFNHPIFLMDVL